MGIVACAGETEKKKQDIFGVIRFTHNNHLSDSRVHASACQNYFIVTALVRHL